MKYLRVLLSSAVLLALSACAHSGGGYYPPAQTGQSYPTGQGPLEKLPTSGGVLPGN